MEKIIQKLQQQKVLMQKKYKIKIQNLKIKMIYTYNNYYIYLFRYYLIFN